MFILNGCAEQKYITHQLTGRFLDNDDKFFDHTKKNHPEMFYCFERSEKLKKMYFLDKYSECIRKSRVIFPEEVSKNEIKDIQHMIRQCTFSEYIYKNKDHIKENMLLSDGNCRGILFYYMLVNDKNDKNKNLFDMYHENAVNWAIINVPETFYCFDKDEDKLQDDLKSASEEAFRQSYNKYSNKILFKDDMVTEQN